MKITDRSDLWWKTAVVYCLDVETYMDWNDDGSGDFEGLAHRLDHLAELGVTCIWLMPFQPTPDRDDGYDITDFLGVDPRLGSLGDVAEFTRTARDRGMRVIIDFVMNHTSERHPWFRSARRSRTSPYRDFYVWRDEPPKKQAATVFPGEEDSVWELDERTGQYYLHSFYRHQPDLNIANPAVRDEIAKTIGYWLELGISGFRVDAVPFLIEPPEGVEIGDPHEFLRDLRRFLQRRSSEAVLLGEVNLPYDQQLEFFGRTGDPPELTMQFDFLGMQALYLSLAREDARPLAAVARQAPRARARGAVGELRAQPRRAHARQARAMPSARRCSTRSRPRTGCASTAAGSCGGCRRCSTATPAASAWSTACCSPCPARPCCSTARRSAWARTPRRRAGRPCARRCSGPTSATAASPVPRPRRLAATPPTDGYAPEHVNVEAQMHDPDSLLATIRQLRGAVPQLARDRLGCASSCCRRGRGRRARAPAHRRRRALRRRAQLRADAHRS